MTPSSKTETTSEAEDIGTMTRDTRNDVLSGDQDAESVAKLQALLPETMATQYDGMKVSEPHWKRLLAAHIKDSADANTTAPDTFGDIKVCYDAGIPDGYALMTMSGEPVGVIDFAAGTAILVKGPVTISHSQDHQS